VLIGHATRRDRREPSPVRASSPSPGREVVAANRPRSRRRRSRPASVRGQSRTEDRQTASKTRRRATGADSAPARRIGRIPARVRRSAPIDGWCARRPRVAGRWQSADERLEDGDVCQRRVAAGRWRQRAATSPTADRISPRAPPQDRRRIGEKIGVHYCTRMRYRSGKTSRAAVTARRAPSCPTRSHGLNGRVRRFNRCVVTIIARLTSLASSPAPAFGTGMRRRFTKRPSVRPRGGSAAADHDLPTGSRRPRGNNAVAVRISARMRRGSTRSEYIRLGGQSHRTRHLSVPTSGRLDCVRRHPTRAIRSVTVGLAAGRARQADRVGEPRARRRPSAEAPDAREPGEEVATPHAVTTRSKSSTSASMSVLGPRGYDRSTIPCLLTEHQAVVRERVLPSSRTVRRRSSRSSGRSCPSSVPCPPRSSRDGEEVPVAGSDRRVC